MKKQFQYKIFLIILCLSIIHSCEMSKMPSSTNIPKIFSSIEFDRFEAIAAKVLISEPVLLKIDTSYQNTIIAYELYEGRIHRKWFFGEIKWKEKTIYTITYQKENDEVYYKLKVESSEAPNENYLKWRSVLSPAKDTKENLIIEKLN